MTSTDSSARGDSATGEARPVAWLDSSGSPSRSAARRGRRRLPHLVAGVLLVVLCVGGAVWWTTSTQDRVPVLALALAVPLGHVLTPADLRSIEVSAAPGVALIPADRAASVLGRPMAISLGAGTLLTQDVVGAAVLPAVGRAVVAVVVKPGQAPPELAAGAPVAVVVTAAIAAGSSATGQALGMSWRATVVGITSAGTDQTTVVSLDLDTAGASQLAQVPAGQLALVMQPAGGER